ncbi:MAG: hypothetical protein H6870_16940 [Methylobacteriaceae bacterium]|nr:hypothetical protein [Methylobacteriaceae bacterium]
MAEDRTRQLGRLGENFFERQCLDSHLSATPPKHDERGWDWFVEFPRNQLPAVFLDSQPPPLKILCQIKATDNFDDRRLSMKLSNFLHLTQTILPAFVVIYEFGGSNAPTKMYLCHFGLEWIAQTLKKVRQSEALGGANLHRQSMVFVADAAEEVLLGSPLADAVKSIIGTDASAYSAKKAEWLRTVGYESGAFQFSLSGAVPVSDFIDATLGLGDLKVEGIEISSLRFGIPLSVEKFSAGVLKITPTSSRMCDMHWHSGRKAGDRLQMHVVVPPLSNLPFELRKARLFNPLLNVTMRNDSVAFTAEVEPNKKYEITELASSLKFIVAASRGSLTVNFAVDGKNFARVSGVRVGRNRLFEELSKRAGIVSTFLSAIGWSKPIELPYTTLFEQGDELGVMSLCDSKLKTSITYTFDSNVEGKIGKNKCIFASPISLKLGTSDYLTAFVYWDARASAIGPKLKISAASGCRVWDVARFGEGDDQKFSGREEQFALFCRDYASQRKLQILSRQFTGV